MNHRAALHAANTNPSYDEFEALLKSKKLDSTLKKCNGFVRRLVWNYSCLVVESVMSHDFICTSYVIIWDDNIL